ncbi:MAG: hypothetical protein ACRCW2_04560 [Cellulosilyticaceae bacterium]
MEKSKSLTLFLGLIPGAGQMYLGLMKKGLCIMLACAVLAMVTNTFGLYSLEVLFPVIWFYSFFDTVRLRHLPLERRLTIEADFAKKVEALLRQDWRSLVSKYRIILCVIGILIGLDMVFSNLIFPYMNYFSSGSGWFTTLFYHLPKSVLGIALLIAGLYYVLQTPPRQ